MTTKTLDDVKADMSVLYDSVRDGETDLKLSDALANITGKFLKAVALQQDREKFLANRGPAPVEATDAAF